MTRDPDGTDGADPPPGTPGTGPLPDPEGPGDLDRTARTLRDALTARAAGTAPTDRLEEIRMSTTRTRRRTTRAWTAVAAAAAVVVVGGGAYALTSGGGDDVRTVASSPTSAPAATASAPAASPSATTTGDDAAPSAAPSRSASAGAAPTRSTTAPSGGLALPAGATSVPVYWTGPGEKLYREWVRADSAAANDPTAALRAMLAGEHADPDYSSPWSPDPDATVTASDGHYVVDVAASAVPGGGAPGTLAVQQLVHTVTAAAGDNAPVELRVAGRAAQTVSRAPQSQVQAPVWITSASARSGGIAVEGVGTAFEGTLLYTVTSADGTEVARDALQAGANGTFGDFSFTVDVPAGRYVVAVSAPDESDGEGSASGDTKDVTVR